MLHWALFKKNVLDSMLLWCACAVCMLLFGWVFVIVNAGWDMTSFQAVIELIPEPFQKLAPVPLDQLTSFDSRLAIFFEDPVIYVVLAAWCISRCSDTVSGQVGSGTMEMLLAQPVSRSEVVVTASVVNLLGAVLLALSAWLGLYVGMQTATVESSEGLRGLFVPGVISILPTEPQETPLHELVNPGYLLPALSNFICLGFFLCGMTTLLSAIDRYRWRTIGVAIAIVIINLVFEVVSQALEALSWLQTFTFFRAYEPVKFATQSVAAQAPQWTWWMRDESGQIIDLGVHSCNSILLALGTICFAVAYFHFRRRDLPAPL